MGRGGGLVDGAANSCPSVLGSIPLSEEKKISEKRPLFGPFIRINMNYFLTLEDRSRLHFVKTKKHLPLN